MAHDLTRTEMELIRRSKEADAERRALLEGVRPLRIRKNVRQRHLNAHVAETTHSLNSLVRRMHEEVQLSEQTTSVLSSSSATLQDTHQQMGTIGQTIRASGKLLHKYGRREFTDKVLLTLALLLYFGVCVYILRKRVLWFTLYDS